jgi:DNA-binding NarL/FixJ family response regulator
LTEGFPLKKQIAELKADHRAERDSRYADRIKAVLMLNSGLSAAKVAEYLLIAEKTIKFSKKKVLSNMYYESFLDFREACLQFFKKRTWNRYRAELDTLLAPYFQILNA